MKNPEFKSSGEAIVAFNKGLDLYAINHKITRIEFVDNNPNRVVVEFETVPDKFIEIPVSEIDSDPSYITSVFTETEVRVFGIYTTDQSINAAMAMLKRACFEHGFPVPLALKIVMGELLPQANIEVLRLNKEELGTNLFPVPPTPKNRTEIN